MPIIFAQSLMLFPGVVLGYPIDVFNGGAVPLANRLIASSFSLLVPLNFSTPNSAAQYLYISPNWR